MSACRTFHRRFLAFDHETAVTALPEDSFVFFEYLVCFHVSQKLAITSFVFSFHLCDHAENDSDFLETFFVCDISKSRIKISPFFVPSTIVNMVAGHLTIMYGLRGPSISIATACTSGVHNIGHAARIIAYGDADVMVAGGAEKASTPLGVGGFGAARALSTRNDNPQAASRPWDKERDGFVLGDGAGMLVLEEYEHAKKRGAKIYAELVGFGMSSDAYHMTSAARNAAPRRRPPVPAVPPPPPSPARRSKMHLPVKTQRRHTHRLKAHRECIVPAGASAPPAGRQRGPADSQAAR